MPPPNSLDFHHAYSYVVAWGEFEQVDVRSIHLHGKDFHGTLGTLDFEFSEPDQRLYAWAFIMPGAGPLLTNRAAIKRTLDQTLINVPNPTGGVIFDIRTLDWNKQASPQLEPCLYLRLEITSAIPVEAIVKKLDALSHAGYLWHSEKMPEVLESYWKQHPPVKT